MSSSQESRRELAYSPSGQVADRPADAPLVMRRAFVVGCPRSGTTLLQALLAGHPMLVSLPETHFFSLARARHGIARLCGAASPRGAAYAGEVFRNMGHTLEPPGQWQVIRKRQSAKWFVASMDRIAVESGACGWVEKTPSHIARIREIERYVPHAKIIHLLRDGREVIASMHQATHYYPQSWGGTRTIDECIERWLRDVKMSIGYAKRPNHLVLLFDELVSSPQSSLQRICEFLTIPYHSLMLAQYSRMTGQVTTPEETWKGGTDRPISSSGDRKFRNWFSPQEQAYVLEKLQEEGLQDLFKTLSTAESVLLGRRTET
jgi:hypothetical protein